MRENDSKKVGQNGDNQSKSKDSAFHPQSGLFGGEKVERKISISATDAKDTHKNGEEVNMKETVIWESPVKGKGAYCYLYINKDTHMVSIALGAYVRHPYLPSEFFHKPLFETDIRCDEIAIFYGNEAGLFLQVDKCAWLDMDGVIKITREGETRLMIYCVDELLIEEEEKR